MAFSSVVDIDDTFHASVNRSVCSDRYMYGKFGDGKIIVVTIFSLLFQLGRLGRLVKAPTALRPARESGAKAALSPLGSNR